MSPARLYLCVCVEDVSYSGKLFASAWQMQEFPVGMGTLQSWTMLQCSILFLGFHVDELKERRIIVH